MEAFFTLMLLTCFFIGGAQTTFQKVFLPSAQGIHDININCVKATSKDIVMCGKIASVTDTTTEFYLLKADTAGNVLLSKKYKGTGYDEAFTVTQTKDRGFILGGQSYNAQGFPSFSVMRMNDTGKLIWSKTYGGGWFGSCNSIIETKDGSFMMVGGIASLHNLGNGLSVVRSNICLTKADSTGNIKWCKLYAALDHSTARYVHELENGDFIVSGYTTLNDSTLNYPNADLFLMKTDSVGNMLWGKSYGGSKDENFDAANTTADGGYLLGGHSYSFHSGVNDDDAYIIRTDSIGNLLWSKNYGNENFDNFCSVENIGSNQYIVAGVISPPGTIKVHICVLNLDSIGNINWGKLISSSTAGIENIGTAHYTNKNIYISGTTMFTINNFDRPYFIKADTLGNSGCNTSNVVLNVMSSATNVTNINLTISSLSLSDTVYATAKDVSLTDTVLCFTTDIQDSPLPEAQAISIFPNPTTGTVTIKAPLQIELVEISSAFGQKVFSTTAITECNHQSSKPSSRNLLLFGTDKTENGTRENSVAIVANAYVVKICGSSLLVL
jgi:hypothetical protein